MMARSRGVATFSSHPEREEGSWEIDLRDGAVAGSCRSCSWVCVECDSSGRSLMMPPFTIETEAAEYVDISGDESGDLVISDCFSNRGFITARMSNCDCRISCFFASEPFDILLSCLIIDRDICSRSLRSSSFLLLVALMLLSWILWFRALPLEKSGPAFPRTVVSFLIIWAAHP